MIRTESHARFHLLATILVIAAGLLFQISSIEWIILILCIGMVWAAEAMNTSIEWLADRITTDEDDQIKQAKDVAAASVMILSICSAIIAILIFSKYFL